MGFRGSEVQILSSRPRQNLNNFISLQGFSVNRPEAPFLSKFVGQFATLKKNGVVLRRFVINVNKMIFQKREG